jgi:hypothetical protein
VAVNSSLKYVMFVAVHCELASALCKQCDVCTDCDAERTSCSLAVSCI